MSNKKIEWTETRITKLIRAVVNEPDTRPIVINERFALEYGGTSGAIQTARLSIARCLQGFEPTSKKGDKMGDNFGKRFTSATNEWYNFCYEGSLSRNILSHKF